MKILALSMAVLVCASAAAVIAWKAGEEGERAAGDESAVAGGSYSEQLRETLAPEESFAAGGEEAGRESGQEATTTGENVEARGGEEFSYTSPDQRYVTETQRHQNFFKALAEGRVRRLDVVSVDYRPVGDPDTSYVYFVVTTDGGRSTGTFVMKYEDGLWRIAAVSQLQGDLEGGTNYPVPSSFEDDLAREIRELQPFLVKVAEGRLAYMTVDGYLRPGEDEAVLRGRVVGKSGRTEPAEMRLEKDYGLWHITYVTNPP